MRKSFLVLAAVVLMALCMPGAVMAQDNADFSVTAYLGSPMVLTLDTNEIAFGTQAFGAAHDIINAALPIVVTVTGDADATYDVMFDTALTAAGDNHPVTMEGPGADDFIVNLQHDSTNALDGAGQEIFNITAAIPLDALRYLTVPGTYAPVPDVKIRVDYN